MRRSWRRKAGDPAQWAGLQGYPTSSIRSKAAATISARPRWSAGRASSAGRTQRASASSSLSAGSPASQRAAKARITKWRSTRSSCVAHDHLAPAGERDRLDGERGLLLDLADQRLVQRLARLDHAARQAEAGPLRRRAGAAHHQHLSVAHDGGAHGEKGAVGIAAVGHEAFAMSASGWI